MFKYTQPIYIRQICSTININNRKMELLPSAVKFPETSKFKQSYVEEIIFNTTFTPDPVLYYQRNQVYTVKGELFYFVDIQYIADDSQFIVKNNKFVRIHLRAYDNARYHNHRVFIDIYPDYFDATTYKTVSIPQMQCPKQNIFGFEARGFKFYDTYLTNNSHIVLKSPFGWGISFDDTDDYVVTGNFCLPFDI